MLSLESVLKKMETPEMLWGIFSLALAVKMLFFFQTYDVFHALTPGDTALGADNLLYIKIAKNIVNGDFSGGKEAIYASATPVYAYFLACCFKFFGESLAVPRLIQLLLGSLVPLVVFLFTKELFSRRAGFFAALLTVMFIPFTYYEGLICKFAFLPLFSTLFLYGLFMAFRYGTFIWWVSATILGAMAYLVRPNIILSILVFFPFCLFYRKRNITRAVLGIALGISIAALPLWLRFSEAQHRDLVSHLGGIHFFIGNNSQATGTFVKVGDFRPGFRSNVDVAKEIAEKEQGKSLNNSEVSAHWYRKGIQWIMHNPSDFAALVLKKLALALGTHEIGERATYDLWTEGSILGLGLPAVIVFFFGLPGLGISYKNKADRRFLVTFVCSYLLGLCLFLVTGRYRLPLFAVLIPTSGYFLDRLCEIDVAGFLGRLKSARSPIGAPVIGFLSLVLILWGSSEYTYSYYSGNNDYGSEYYIPDHAGRYVDLTPATSAWTEIKSVACEADGGVWMGLDGDGLLYRASDGSLKHWTTSNSQLPDNKVNTVILDGSGGVWAGTGDWDSQTRTGGVIHYRYDSWDSWFTTSNSPLDDFDIESLLLDGSGGIWIGTDEGGLGHHKGNGTWDMITTGSGVKAMVADGAGGVWAATSKKGVLHVSGASIIDVIDTSDGLPTSEIESLASDNAGGLWIGTEEGLVHFKNGQVVSRYDKNNTPFPDNEVNALLIDNAGNLWVGTDEGGLLYLDQGGNWHRFDLSLYHQYMGYNDVNSICSDGKGHIWIGTSGGLLYI